MNPINENQEIREPEERSIKDIFLYYLSYWKYIVISVIICSACAFVYLKFQNPVYRTNTKLMIKDERRGSTVNQIDIFSDLGGFSSTNLDNETEVLKSRTLSRRVADSLKLQVKYYREELVRKIELYKSSPIDLVIEEYPTTPSYFEVSLDNEGKFLLSDTKSSFTAYAGDKIVTPWGTFTLNITANEQTYPIWISIDRNSSFSFQANRSSERNSAVLDLSTDSEIPQKGRDILNTLVHFYNEQSIQDKQAVTEATLIFIDDRIEEFSTQLEIAEKGVEQYKRDHDLTNVQSDASLLRNTGEEYSKRISEVQGQLILLKSTEEDLLKEENRFEIIPTLMGISDQSLIGLINKYNEIALERKRVSENVADKNTMLRDLDTQLAQYRNNILHGIKVLEGNINSTLENLRSQEDDFSRRIRNLSTNEREIHEMTREKDMIEKIFIYLLEKREETAIMKTTITSNARIIDYAWTSPIPISPKIKIIYLAALLLGLIIPVAIITIIDLFDNKIRSKDELEKLVMAPIVGQVPDIKKKQDIFLSPTDNTGFAEMYRQLSTNLTFMLANQDNKVIMVTSSVPAEGKSTFSVNLAITYLSLGKRVLLIDLDMRNSNMKSIFHPKTTPVGISSYLADKSVSESAIVQKASDKIQVDFVYAGIFPPNPAELLMSSRLGDFFKWAESNYDYIIVDTPPVGYVSDAFIIGKHVDASIYIVRTDITHKQYIRQSEQIYKTHRLHNMCYAVKGVVRRNRYGYGYGGYAYGYGYGYGGKNGDRYGSYYGKKRS